VPAAADLLAGGSRRRNDNHEELMLDGFGGSVLIEIVAEVFPATCMFGGRPLEREQWEREVER
jgi:hypothetical protein